MSEIVIDFGEDGQVVVEATNTYEHTNIGGPTDKTGLREVFEQAGNAVTASAERVLRAPLKALVNMFVATLPSASSNQEFQLDEFTVEFSVGLKAEAGANAIVVAKIMPEGTFKCTYKWKHQSPSSSA